MGCSENVVFTEKHATFIRSEMRVAGNKPAEMGLLGRIRKKEERNIGNESHHLKQLYALKKLRNFNKR